MSNTGDVLLVVNGEESQTPSSPVALPPASGLIRWRWWLLVVANIFFLLTGQTVVALLGRLYYSEGGSSQWMSTISQSTGFPVLFVPLILLTYRSPASKIGVPARTLAAICLGLGLYSTGNSLMYSYGLRYLPVSTFSLISASQLAFNVVFAYFLNGQKITALIINSAVIVTFSAAIIGVNSDNSGDAPRGKFALGLILTLAGSAMTALNLSLVQLLFQKVLKSVSFTVVLKLQICTSVVAATAAVVGLFASGEAGEIRGEVDAYRKGKTAYVMTLVGTAVANQVSSVGGVGLVFMVSSLFSNVVGTVALPIVPIFAVVFFGDKMDGLMVITLLMAIWGFASYVYQQYLDDQKTNNAMTATADAE
ncbi:probable purine permease 11 [Zingiber officinale]|uniref:probable purine permease 11 n=1 Tax=Zingiber officinale TaxID=94328 RepID=UPI001C4BD932|nr:probable purine permease 11 [Zingiber officinale]